MTARNNFGFPYARHVWLFRDFFSILTCIVLTLQVAHFVRVCVYVCVYDYINLFYLIYF